jgi:hypothetical protein
MGKDCLSLQEILETGVQVPLAELKKYPELVRQIQQSLVNVHLLPAGRVSSVYDEETEEALREFCRAVWLDTFSRGMVGPSLASRLMGGLCSSEPAGKVEFTTHQKPGLGLADYKIAAKQFQLEEAVLRAVVKVESAGHAFVRGRPVILFEAHWFSYFTKGKYDRSHPSISCPVWNRSLYKGGEREWKRLQQAEELDPTAAYLSTSWGLGQVLGMNYQDCGYRTVQEFVMAMNESAFHQLQAMLRFIEKAGLLGALRRKDWHTFAKGYNGPSYYIHGYAEKLEQAYLSELSSTRSLS